MFGDIWHLELQCQPFYKWLFQLDDDFKSLDRKWVGNHQTSIHFKLVVWGCLAWLPPVPGMNICRSWGSKSAIRWMFEDAVCPKSAQKLENLETRGLYYPLIRGSRHEPIRISWFMSAKGLIHAAYLERSCWNLLQVQPLVMPSS